MKYEGYVKYTSEHKMGEAIEAPHWSTLNEARNRLYEMGLVGATAEGIGFGNLSIRYKDSEFLITGTGTGVEPVLGLDGYCLVNSFNPMENHVVSTGPIKASSESMTHGVVYQSWPDINCVIHIHSRKIFDGMLRDNYPATPADSEYGTPEIAVDIGVCVFFTGKNEGEIVLAGHDEGVITYGPTVEKALDLILELFKKYGG